MPSNSRRDNLERIALALSCAAVLVAWILMYFFDLNHPPGVRMARLTGAAMVIALGALEAARPWAGFYLFLLLWPQMWVFRDFLQDHVSDIFGALPMVTSGPAAAALGLGFVIRNRRLERPPADAHSVETCDPAALAPANWIRACLWCLAAIWTVSAFVATLRLLRSVPPGWRVDAPDWRHLSGPSAFSALAPAASVLRIVPELLLGLLVLNDLCRKDKPAAKIPLDTLLRVAGISAGLIAAEVLLEVLTQRITGHYWSFDENPPGGPFNNRNTASPVLIVFGLLCFAAARRNPERALPWRAFGGVLFGFACLIASRNGLFMAAMLGLILIVSRAHKAKKLWLVGALLLLAAGLCAGFPLPQAETISSTSVKRIVETLEQLRAGDWGAVTSYRSELYASALKIFAHHPVLGSGPATFPMLASPGALYAVEGRGAYYSAHSMPLNLLAETGLAGMCAWAAIWIVAPSVLLWRQTRKSLLWMAVLAMGIGNLLDTVWFAAGMTTMTLLIIWWACWESAVEPRLLPKPGVHGQPALQP